MKALQRRISATFDSRSVMLFTALTLGGTGALQAQTAPAKPQFGPGATTTAPQSESTFPMGPGPAKSQSTAAADAFERADANKDGQLSAKEATQLPAIAQRFKELDADKNGMLSRSEFDKGANS